MMKRFTVYWIFALLLLSGMSVTSGGNNEAPMVKVPGGPFVMGDNDGELDERPVRRVTLKAFRIDKYEVTYAYYEGCVAEGLCTAPKWAKYIREKSLPVTGISWRDAVNYCTWVRKRLPTEAEWEKAARGADGNKYPWGDTIDCTYAGYRECGLGRILPVGSYPKGASPYGAMDMAANVYEWVADYYNPNYYRTAPPSNPPGPGTGKYRVVRGGSYLRPLAGMRSADRAGFKPHTRADDIGFRCVADD